ncbi:outer membrane lipoprotein-sorting protein [Occallatibacter savannae]|uniref:outer membrane lipoprotein-sorting protein n=1 Tax=Occallatibacter savannae TaxID=1002691 RepID=UPI000D6987A0|nr:outer membrane lipoprotein-sorting protein [Occallatibacter savannae]
MRHKLVVAAFILGSAFSRGYAAESPQAANLSATDIVAKNVASRGGLTAWRKVQTLQFEGKLGAGGDKRGTLPSPEAAAVSRKISTPRRLAEEAELPFTMQLQRPRKTRLEVEFKGQNAIQVYDGTNGWKLRPFLNRLEVEPYSAQELKMASQQSDLDGPLVDYAAKGSRVESDGVEQVEGKPNYKLRVTTRSGQVTHVWIDSATFLESKIEGQPRELDGKMHPVEIYYRDYREVEGLKIPFILETRVLPPVDEKRASREPLFPPEKIEIERVTVNPKLDSARFSKPPVTDSVSRPKGM